VNNYIRIEEYITADLSSNLKALTFDIIIPFGSLMSVRPSCVSVLPVDCSSNT